MNTKEVPSPVPEVGTRDWSAWLPPGELPAVARPKFVAGQVLALANHLGRCVFRVEYADPKPGREYWIRTTVLARTNYYYDEAQEFSNMAFTDRTVLIQDVGQPEPTPPHVLYGTPSPSPTGKVALNAVTMGPPPGERLAGRFPPQKGDVWRRLSGDEQVFSGDGTRDEQGYEWCESTFLNGGLTFVRHAPEVSGEVGAKPAHVHRWGPPRNAIYSCTHKNNPNAPRCDARAVVGCDDKGCQESEDIIARCEAHREDRAPTPVPLPVERRRVKTYQELMREERERDGVKGQVSCLRCGKPSRLNTSCAACHAFDDARVALKMRMIGDTKPVAEPPPWTPQDPDSDIPNVWDRLP